MLKLLEAARVEPTTHQSLPWQAVVDRLAGLVRTLTSASPGPESGPARSLLPPVVALSHPNITSPPPAAPVFVFASPPVTVAPRPLPPWAAAAFWTHSAVGAEQTAAAAVVHVTPAGGVFADGVVVHVLAAPADEVRGAGGVSLPNISLCQYGRVDKRT